MSAKNREARRRAELASAQAKKAQQMKNPKGNSNYARKKRRPEGWIPPTESDSRIYTTEVPSVPDVPVEQLGAFNKVMLPGTNQRIYSRIVNGKVIFG